MAAGMGATRRTLVRRLARATATSAAAAAAAAGALGASGCAQRTVKTPVEITWYSWGPQYPTQWTVGPGLNQRAGPQFGFGGGGPGQPTPVPPEKVLEQQIAPFVADRDDLTVKIVTERFDKYNDKLKAFAGAGQVPDVVAYDGPQALSLIRASVFYNLSRLQGGKVRQFLQNFQPGYLDASMYRGKLYGVPYQSRQLVLYVNKTLFGGLSLPPAEWGSPNWTWQHFMEKAASLTLRAIGGGPRQYGTLHSGRPMWAAMVRQNGGQEFNRDISRTFYDSPETIEALQTYADLVNRNRVAPTERENPGGNNWRFDAGNVAMWVWYQHSIPAVGQRVQGFDWDVYPLPMNKRSATYADWGYLSISANTVDVDRAWELISFLESPDGDALALREGVAGPIQKGAEPRYLVGSGASTKNKAAAIQAAQQPIAYRPQHDAWEQLQSLQSFYLAPVFRGEQKANYACRELRVVADGVLAGLDAPKAPAIGSDPGEGGSEGG